MPVLKRAPNGLIRKFFIQAGILDSNASFYTDFFDVPRRGALNSIRPPDPRHKPCRSEFSKKVFYKSFKSLLITKFAPLSARATTFFGRFEGYMRTLKLGWPMPAGSFLRLVGSLCAVLIFLDNPFGRHPATRRRRQDSRRQAVWVHVGNVPSITADYDRPFHQTTLSQDCSPHAQLCLYGGNRYHLKGIRERRKLKAGLHAA